MKRPSDSLMSENSSNTIGADLVALLRCPLTKSRLRLEGDWLIAEVGGLAYPVRDGIPVMLIEEARLPAGYASLDALKASLANKLPR
jgi:uncharacterized protein YbaR (Trm112 family)